MSPKIFRAYDIRGRVPVEFDVADAGVIARGLGAFFGKGPVVVGHDGRRSSLALYRAVQAGLEASGRRRLIALGLATTPMFYYFANALPAAGGIMVTASHNPKEYNGLKVLGAHGLPMSGKEIQRLISRP